MRRWATGEGLAGWVKRAVQEAGILRNSPEIGEDFQEFLVKGVRIEDRSLECEGRCRRVMEDWDTEGTEEKQRSRGRG